MLCFGGPPGIPDNSGKRPATSPAPLVGLEQRQVLGTAHQNEGVLRRSRWRGELTSTRLGKKAPSLLPAGAALGKYRRKHIHHPIEYPVTNARFRCSLAVVLSHW